MDYPTKKFQKYIKPIHCFSHTFNNSLKYGLQADNNILCADNFFPSVTNNTTNIGTNCQNNFSDDGCGSKIQFEMEQLSVTDGEGF